MMSENSNTNQFTYRILIQPLGLLYGSKGRFLSPENLVGRSGIHFPPDTPTLSGLFAYYYQGDLSVLGSLMLAGPFWAEQQEPENFYVPTPFHCWVQGGYVTHLNLWQNGRWQFDPVLTNEDDSKKRQFDTWISLRNWSKVRSPTAFEQALASGERVPVEDGPWKDAPHLHPRLRPDERRSVGKEDSQGSLFLEYGIEVHPSACLVYLSNVALPDGCYRFGGEGHLVEITSKKIQPDEPIQPLLDAELDRSFATICPGVWGSNRLSYRAPLQDKDTGEISWPGNPVKALLTNRPTAFRFRLGNQRNCEDTHKVGQPKLLSRGRYAVPGRSVYVVEHPLEPWLGWNSDPPSEGGWFPMEGHYTFKRWGCGLSLPLEITSA